MCACDLAAVSDVDQGGHDIDIEVVGVRKVGVVDHFACACGKAGIVLGENGEGGRVGGKLPQHRLDQRAGRTIAFDHRQQTVWEAFHAAATRRSWTLSRAASRLAIIRT